MVQAPVERAPAKPTAQLQTVPRLNLSIDANDTCMVPARRVKKNQDLRHSRFKPESNGRFPLRNPFKTRVAQARTVPRLNRPKHEYPSYVGGWMEGSVVIRGH
ncbi:hypothetical protein B0H17DRAFT_1155183 [Mycena rosella]|uniref:Uncharacterized protein n=1 Tax=Mycena rosella TaxID=1033263 RepID=A0AAD7AWI4_MYCRO|nr:hypothetical protein B0H17DRAFT_1155183 [Mycena rosella]